METDPAMPKTRCILAAAALAAMLVAAGCGNEQQTVATKVNYRTVRADPLRNTPVARRENQRGLEHLGKDRLEEAAQAFQRALEADKTYGPAHNNLGKVYLRKFEYNAAKDEFQAAIEYMPNHPAPRNNLGLALEKAWVADRHLSSIDEAIACYEKAVALAPESIEYAANLARALDRRGDRTDKLRHLLLRIVREDTRQHWKSWARMRLVHMGHPLD
jgi:tetratricopeptide (TPR) repeat protein